MTKKKKLKIKKKNFTIFIIFLILICFCFTGLTSLIIRNFSNEKTKSDEKTFTNNKDLSEKDKKLKKLGNINKKISYFKMSNLDRYITYKEKNNSLSNTQIVKDVNMDLDKDPYTDMKEAKNLNKINILVNKHNYLKENYVPNNLEQIDTKYALSNMSLVNTAKYAFENMSKEANKENLKIIAMSTYRSYEYQVQGILNIRQVLQ